MFIWRASLLSVGIVELVYLPLAIAMVGTGAHTAGAGAQTPLVLLAEHVFGPSASRVVGIAGLLPSFIPVNAYVVGTSRLAFALSQRRQLPSWLGGTDASGTPQRALWALFAVSMLALAESFLFRLRIADLLPLHAWPGHLSSRCVNLCKRMPRSRNTLPPAAFTLERHR